MRQFRTYSLRSKLIVAFLVVALTPLGLLGFLNERATRTTLTENANQVLLAAAVRTAADLDAFINSNLNSVKTEAKLPILREYLSLPLEQQPEKVAQVIATLRALSLKDNVYISSVALLNLEGKTLNDTYGSDIGRDKSDRDYFQRPLETGLPYVSPIELFPTDFYETGFYFSAPIRDTNSQIIGLLSVRYRMSILQRLIVTHNGVAGEDSFAILLDENHVRLADGRTPELIFKSVVPLDPTELANLQAALRLPSGSVAERSTNLPDFEEGLINAKREPYFTSKLIALDNSVASMAVTTFKKKSWFIVFAQPQAVFLAPIERQTRNTLLLALVIAVLVSVAAIGVTQRLSSPIIELTTVAEKITAGDLTAQAFVGATDEIGILASAFNKMTSQLGGLIHNLRTTQKQLIEAKRAAEAANQAKSEFLSNMSHELRTPLNGILGYTQILQKDENLSPAQIKGLSIIYQSGNYLLTLLNDILDMSKIEAGKMELMPSGVHLASFLEGIVSIMRIKAEEKDVSFIYQPDKALPVGVQVDEKRLRQVLINLLGNAVKFTEQGKVIFRITNRTSPGSPLASCRLRFEVADTGIGMTAEQFQKIFQPFEQVGTSKQRMGGTGLGLAITRKLLSLMSSEVQFKSQLGQGSTFWFDLSLVVISKMNQKENGTGGIKAPSQIIAYQGRRRKVLIADDKLQNRLVLKDMLTPLGFELLEAENGQACVALARQEQPDMILIDLVMPVMSGFDAVKMIRQQPATQSVPIIAISASVFEEHQKQSQLVGCDAFLAKPVRLDNLLTLLGTYLDLSWIYADSTKEQVISSQEERLIAPPPQELEKLHQLAMRGNIPRLRKQADYLASLDQQYVPFAKELRELAQGFKRKQILALLKQFMDGSH